MDFARRQDLCHILEYVWLDGGSPQDLRSKVKTFYSEETPKLGPGARLEL